MSANGKFELAGPKLVNSTRKSGDYFTIRSCRNVFCSPNLVLQFNSQKHSSLPLVRYSFQTYYGSIPLRAPPLLSILSSQPKAMPLFYDDHEVFKLLPNWTELTTNRGVFPILLFNSITLLFSLHPISLKDAIDHRTPIKRP